MRGSWSRFADSIVDTHLSWGFPNWAPKSSRIEVMISHVFMLCGSKFPLDCPWWQYQGSHRGKLFSALEVLGSAHSASNPRKGTEKWKNFWKILSFSYLFCIFLEVTIVLVAWSLLVSTHSSVSGQAPQSPPGVLTAGTQATLPRSGFVKKNRWYPICTPNFVMCMYVWICMYVFYIDLFFVEVGW